MRSKYWPLFGLLVGLPLFLANCVHMVCMTGVTCVPVIGPPKWLEKRMREADVDRSIALYKASLTPLHLAIRDGDAARVEEILRQAPEQAQFRTASDETPLELAVATEHADPRIVELLLGAGAELVPTERSDFQTATWFLGVGTNLSAGGKHKSILSQAVDVNSPNPEIIALLLQAGAEGFDPNCCEGYAFQTPFGRVLNLKHDPALVEVFLSTGKLDPLSKEASKYLEYSARQSWMFERLLAYGVPLERAPDTLNEAVTSGTNEALQTVLRLSADTRSLDWEESRATALRSSVSGCEFDKADLLLEAGASVKGTGDDNLARVMSENCVTGRFDRSFSDAERAARDSLLRKLVAAGVDPNEADNYYGCPAWLGGGPYCKVPNDLDLVKTYLDLGADPFRRIFRDGRGGDTALGIALRGGLLDGITTLMLARYPLESGPSSKAGLDRSLGILSDPRFSGDERIDIAYCLIAMEADVNVLQDDGGTTLGGALLMDDAVYREAAGFLLEKGMSLDAQYGYTALYWMLDHEEPRMDRVLWLVQHGARLENVLNKESLPKSLRGPQKAAIIKQIRAVETASSASK